jgi:hypothetical protein
VEFNGRIKIFFIKLDYHYHGDPYGDGVNCMYTSADYTSTTSHPPVIGYISLNNILCS